MGDAAEASTLSYIDVLLKSLDKSLEADQVGVAGEGRGKGEEHVVPDSTTSHTPSARVFRLGDDVLVPKQDGKYYLGSIIQLSNNGPYEYETESRCLIKFGDGTRSWAATGDVKLLSAPPPDDGRLMCVVCKQREGAAGTTGAAVIACDMCGRGYHAKCHTPVIETCIQGASWNCRRCVDQRYKVAAAENRAQKRSVMRVADGRVQFPGFNQQPCDTASTTSSTTSEHGKDESHCYCGEKSDWLAQMLMCCRCSRWFHQRCVSSLQYPLYAGDKMYIFACSTCNGGAEFLRRLELRWLDLAHLALYNLTAYNSRNYFDLDAVIMPYITDNWHALQLPQKMWCTSARERRERVLGALTGSRVRFKSGREMKKRATIWGLRVRRPPPQPQHLHALAQVKENEPLTDELVSSLAPRLRFLPRTRSLSPSARHDTPLRNSTPTTGGNNGNSSYTNHNQNMIVPVDGHWLNLMMGKRFHQNLNNDTENDSPCSSPSPTEFMNNTLSNHSAGLALRYDVLKMNDVSTDSTHTFDDEADNPPAPQKLTKSKQLRLYKYDYRNGGFVKKSVPFTNMPSSKNMTRNDNNKVKTRPRNGELNLNEKRLQNRTKDKKRETTPIRNFSNFSRNPRDEQRSPSADPEIILKGDCSTSSFDSAKKLESDAVLSRSESPLPPSELSRDSETIPSNKDCHPSLQSDILQDKDCPLEKLNIQSAHTSKIAAMNLEISKMSTTSIIEHSKIMSLQQIRPEYLSRGLSNDRESSGDEILGRGTLDAIIPPLKDFHGKNNPFLTLNSAGKQSFSIANKLFNKQAKQSLPKNGIQPHAKTRLSLPMHLTPVIPPMRTLKRQLSEKDIIIGPNGEVKRRKLKRGRKNGQLNSSCPLPGDGSKASHTYPKQSNDEHQTAFNGRKLRQRQERNYLESGRRSGAGPARAPAPLQLSPRKGEPPQQLSDLKSSVRSYFGALTRMRDGDAFRVTARRTCGAGRTQYLIEWAASHAT